MHPAALLSRYWPFANGSGRVIDRLCKGIDLGHGTRQIATSDGFPISVLADDHIGRHIILSGKFDRSLVQVLIDHGRPGDLLLDIGANVGYVSACFLARVPGSRAICIEPQPGIFELLEGNLAQFGDRAHAVQVALSDATGELSFHVDPANRGASRIASDGATHVKAQPAGELLRTLGRVDLIKIDVEGHELPIFLSMAQELARLRPRAILFEHHGRLAAPEGEIGQVLAHAGYRIYGIRKRLLKTELVPINQASDCGMNDYLALPNT